MPIAGIRHISVNFLPILKLPTKIRTILATMIHNEQIKIWTHSTSPFRRAVMVVLLLLNPVFIPAGSAEAASRLCNQLQARLASVSTGRAQASLQYRRYARAVEQQQIQINKTVRAARKRNCNSSGTAVCARLNDSLQKMSANIRALKAKRDQLAPRGSVNSANQRRNILGQMQKNGCLDNQNEQASLDRPNRRKNLLEQIFGKSSGDDAQTPRSTAPQNRTVFRGRGTYRTLCVRACDGYFFPISFSTTSKFFENDLAACRTMCPGAKTGLFYTPVPNGDLASAISFPTEQAYSSLTNAFAYKKSVNPECGCGKAGAMTLLAGAENRPLKEVKIDKKPVRLPSRRVDAYLDPDTIEAGTAGMNIERLKQLVQKRDDENGRTKKPVRMVGPVFFPVQ